MSSNRLHILNGDAIVAPFTEHFRQEDYFVWREALCQGPLSYSFTDIAFRIARVQFLESGLEAKIESHLFDQLKDINLNEVEEIILWFEYDLFCQVNLMATVSWLVQQNYGGNVAILDLEKYQKGSYIGLGQINADEYPSIFENRLKLDNKEIAYIDLIWSKISSRDYQLLPLLNDHTHLSRFNTAIRTAAVYSNSIGIGAALIESRIYTTLKHTGLTMNKLIGNILASSQDLGYGNVQILYVIKELLKSGVLVQEEELVLKS